MAADLISDELRMARMRIATSRQKMSLHIDAGNLTLSGQLKPTLGPTASTLSSNTAPGGNDFETACAKSSQQVDREVTGRDTLLQPKARWKARQQRPDPVASAPKVEALKLACSLSVPIARDLRPSNADGATSFHFQHVAIAKGRGDKTSARGTKTRTGSAKEHAKYLERESAVARKHETGNELAGTHGIELQIEIGKAANGGRYIEREEALAHQQNGVPIIYSNISKTDPAKRQAFWELVEKHESTPQPDKLKFTIDEAPDFWENVRTDPCCPPALAQAIVEAYPSLPFEVVTDDNEPIRKMMADHGWQPPLPKKPNETSEEEVKRTNLNLLNSKGAKCIDGRGGHIQCRIVGELPHDVSHEARDRILSRFTDVFEEMRLPYVAVMHAPDHANNDKNWHFHLAYYERPYSLFTGKFDDYLKRDYVAESLADQGAYDKKANALNSGELNEFVGQMDFTVPVTHTTACGHTRTSFPFAQAKVRKCNHKDFPLQLRKLLAEFTNDELELGRLNRRVDPRSYTEMGISKEADEHLGNKSAQLEVLGIPTPVGISNEQKQWDSILETIRLNLLARNKAVVNQQRRWSQDLEAYELAPVQKNEVAGLISGWAEAQREANEHRAIAQELEEQYERCKSRALKVANTCQRHIAAVADGTANDRQKKNRDAYEARLHDSNTHLGGLTIVMAGEVAQARQCNELAQKLESKADGLKGQIQAQLTESFERVFRGQAKVTEKREVAAGQLKSSVLEPPGSAKLQEKTSSQIITDPPVADADRAAFETQRKLTQAARSLETAAPNDARDVRVGHTTEGAAINPMPASDHESVRVLKGGPPIMDRIDEVERKATAVHETRHESGCRYYLDKEALPFHGIKGSDIEPVYVQRRLATIYGKQKHEKARLVAFAKSRPERMVVRLRHAASGAPSFVEIPLDAPPALRNLAEKYAHHAKFQLELADVVDTALKTLGEGVALAGPKVADVLSQIPPASVNSASDKLTKSDASVGSVARKEPMAGRPLRAAVGEENTAENSLEVGLVIKNSGPPPLFSSDIQSLVDPYVGPPPTNQETFDSGHGQKAKILYTGQRARPANEPIAREPAAAEPRSAEYAIRPLQAADLTEAARVDKPAAAHLSPAPITTPAPFKKPRSAFRILMEETERRLGTEWLRLKEDFTRFRHLPSSSERDRLAYIINSKINVAVGDRVKFPALANVFAGSDRNLLARQRAREVSTQVQLGTWPPSF
jgi:hypothetical protein